MKFPLRALALTVALSFTLVSTAQTTAPTTALPPPAAGDEVQPKFIWGLVLNLAFKLAMGLFSDWLTTKLTADLSNTTDLNRIMLNTANALVVSLADTTPFGTKSIGHVDNTVTVESKAAVKVENGKVNYQGVHVAVVAFDKSGTPLRVQPVTEGFHTGDRFKIKILPTFDGLLVIENINPNGVLSQIYPAASVDVVSVKAGVEIFVPLGKDEAFEFAGQTGEEQLRITLRDPRAFGNAESKAPASRKDDKLGSSFVQETPPGTYPVIAQSIQLVHGQ
jgi:hypothetical protein